MAYRIVLDGGVPPELRDDLSSYHVTTTSQLYLSLESTEDKLRELHKHGCDVLVTTNPDAGRVAKDLNIPVTVVQYRGSGFIDLSVLKLDLERDWRMKGESPQTVYRTNHPEHVDKLEQAPAPLEKKFILDHEQKVARYRQRRDRD